MPKQRVVFALIAVLLASGMALGSPADATPEHLDSVRCAELTEQFSRIAADMPISSTSRALAGRGVALCRHGQYADGAATLERVVRRLGKEPVSESADSLSRDRSQQFATRSLVRGL